jgi:NADPH-dependent curcumin reductase CurA
MTIRNRKVVLAARPAGEPKPEHFRLVDEEVAEPGDGQVLLKTLWLSIDPYMRGRMSAARSYAKPVEVGDVMVGSTVSEVVKSKNPAFKPGDVVLGYTGWQEYALSDGRGLIKLDAGRAPVSAALGVLGMPGLTAYAGLLTIGKPKTGETVAVAAAAGPVGSAVGQIAKVKGCRAVGIAGGPDKCRYLIEELGFDAAVDHRAPDMKEKLKAACPNGVDVYFENVGGAVWDAVLPLLNDFARVPVCGLVAHYNDTELPPGPDRMPLLMGMILRKRLTLRGFIVTDFADQMPAFVRDMGEWLAAGKIKYREDIVDGLDQAPAALIGVLKGKNFGKQLVRIT